MSTDPSGKLSTLLSNESVVREGIRNGQCHIVSLAPIRDALGERWDKNRNIVHDFALRSFQREARADDLFIRINDLDFFLIQPSRTAFSALSRATSVNWSCLEHFLGLADPENIRISIIEQALPAGLTARRATSDEIAAAHAAAAALAEAENPFARKPRQVFSLDTDSPPWEAFGTPRKPLRIILVKRPEGHDLEASYYTEPIWNTARQAVAIFQLRSQTYYQTGTSKALVQPDDLTARTLGLIATRRLNHAADMLQASNPQGLAINVPLSLHALAHSASRVAVMNALRKITQNPDHQARLFIELEEIPPDVPLVRISEAVAQIKAYVRRVTVRAPSLKSDLTELCRSGAEGVILSLDADNLSASSLKRLKTQAQKGGGYLAVDGASTASMADLCHAVGLHEVCGEAITQAYGERFVPAPLSLSEICGHYASKPLDI